MLPVLILLVTSQWTANKQKGYNTYFGRPNVKPVVRIGKEEEAGLGPLQIYMWLNFYSGPSSSKEARGIWTFEGGAPQWTFPALM